MIIYELEKASAKIDRFGWDRMEQWKKDGLMSDWCDLLSPFPIPKIKAGINRLFEASKGSLRSINEYQVKAEIIELDRIELSKLPKAPEPQAEPRSAPDSASKARIAQELEKAFPKALTAQQMNDRRKDQ